MTERPSKSRVIAEIKECLVLAVPLAGAQLSQSTTTFVDTIIMGILGNQMIAAGALGAVTFYLLITVGSAIISAVSPLVAEAYGAGRIEQVGRVVRQGLWLSVILAIPATLLTWHSNFVYDYDRYPVLDASRNSRIINNKRGKMIISA